MILTDEMTKNYHRDGYTSGPILFDANEVTEIKQAVNDLVVNETDINGVRRFDPNNRKLIQIVNGYWQNEVIKKVVGNAELGQAACQLMDSKYAYVSFDQVLYKAPYLQNLPSNIGNVGWHQDASHRTIFKTPNFCTAWISLGDIGPEQGGMSFLPGSHQWGFQPETFEFDPQGLNAIEQKFQKVEPQPCHLKAGQVHFHSGFAFHGSGPNLSDDIRYSIAINYIPENTRYNHQGCHHVLEAQLTPFIADNGLCGPPIFHQAWPIS